MSTKTNSETNGCIFQWKIENISHCWLKKGVHIASPKFIADVLEDTKWWLRLHPISKSDENCISFYLHRDEDSSGPDIIEVNYQIAFLDKDGLILKERTEFKERFKKPDNWGFPKFLAREKVFLTERESFLPEDTLTIQCTVWHKGEKPIKPKYLNTRTVFKVNRRSFMWKISGFSTVQPGIRKKIKENLFEFDLVLNEGFNGLDICIISLDDNIRYILYKTSFIDSEGKTENCGIKKYFPGDLMKGVLSSMLIFPRMWLENKSRYIPNDDLTLYFEFVFSTIEHFGYSESSNFGTVFIDEEKSQKISDLTSDFKSMYNDGIFSDTTLRTSTKTFPAHKNILSARSAVFRNMFSHDMKEASSGQVEITDLEENTIHRMLLYMYTDSLEDLQLESASKLYTAADKYKILSLKGKCCSFIKDNLSPTKVCSILVLADLHQDNDLKSFTENYILEHDKEVMGCQEWKDFMNTNSKLAAHLMYRKLFPD